MAEVKHGSIVLQLPADYELHEKAGKMDQLEVSRIPKVPQGIRKICDDVADALEKSQGKFTGPAGITPEMLRAAGKKAEQLDPVLQDLKVIQTAVQQSALKDKDFAFDLVRRVNDFVHAYGKRNKEYWSYFGRLKEFFAKIRGRRSKPEPIILSETPAPAVSSQPIK